MKTMYKICGKFNGVEVFRSKEYPTYLGAKRVMNRLRREHPENKYQMHIVEKF